MGLIIKKRTKTDTGESIEKDLYGRVIPELNDQGNKIFAKLPWYRNKSDYKAGDKEIRSVDYEVSEGVVCAKLKSSFILPYDRVIDGSDILQVALDKIKLKIIEDHSGWTTNDVIIEELTLLKNGK